MGNKMLAISESKMQDAATATGDGASLDMNGFGGGTLHATGISGDTIAVEATIDGENWGAISIVKTDGTLATTITANGVYQITRCSVVALRTRISTYGAGTITVWGRASAN